MIFCSKILQDYKKSIENIINSFKMNKKDRETEYRKINTIFLNVDIALQEALYLENSIYQISQIIKNLQQNIISDYKKLLNEPDNLNNEEIVLNIKTNLEDIPSRIDDVDAIINNRYYSGCYSEENCDIDIIKNIFSKINSENEKNIFYNRCKSDNFYVTVDNLGVKINGYGLSHVVSTEIKMLKNTKKIILGKVIGSRISNDCFDMSYIYPTVYKDTGNQNSHCFSMNQDKIEKDYIVSDLRYLRKGGIAIIKMPYFRLHFDVCKTLSRYLDNISIIKSSKDYSSPFIYIIGKKNVTTEIKENEFTKLRNTPRNILSIGRELETEYTLNNKIFELGIFKGSAIDMEEIRDISNTDLGVFEEFYSDINEDKTNRENINPLLPFNIGQIGLVLTSGCLDGIVDEQQDEYHIIKGRVKKSSETKEVHDGENKKEIETISNKVEINILLPNGDLKTLT